jgi:ATP-dependent Clp protease protease subunit
MADMNSLPLPLDRTLFFAKDVNLESIELLSRNILRINEDDDHLEKLYGVYDIDYVRKPIKIMIDSYGGYVYQCMGLLGIMEKSTTPIHTYATGAAMSCGFMILISGHKRFAYKHATPMYHQVSTGFWGKTQDMEESYKETKRLQQKFENITLDLTKISKAKLKDILKTKQDWYMDSKEALSYGVIDEIIE